MDTFGLIVLVVTLLVSFGVLIGFTISELLIGARTRRQAAVQVPSMSNGRRLMRNGKKLRPQAIDCATNRRAAQAG
jgi:hypothetical protein